MQQRRRQVLGFAALAALFVLAVPAVWFGERALLWMAGPREAVRGGELTAMDLAFLRGLGVVAGDEEILWVVAHDWPSIRERAELIVTDRRVVRFWPEVVHDRRSAPDEAMLRHEERLYGMRAIDLTRVVDVDTEIRNSASGNSLTLSLADGSQATFCVYDTSRGDLARIRADILRH